MTEHLTQKLKTESVKTSKEPGVLEHVVCAVCSADDYDVVYPAQYDREKDADLADKFRASGDELLIVTPEDAETDIAALLSPKG